MSELSPLDQLALRVLGCLLQILRVSSRVRVSISFSIFNNLLPEGTVMNAVPSKHRCTISGGRRRTGLPSLVELLPVQERVPELP